MNRDPTIMDQDKKDAGTIAALMIRMQEYRLPRAKRMLERVDSGEKLSDSDIAFLNRVYEDSRNTESLIKRNPEYNDLVVRFIDLYTEIVTKGVENEKSA
ncbi:hypothetical protein ACFL07_09945 [Pseudomonadota bacterium]